MPTAVAELYAVFGRYPHPARMEGCPCCVGADESRPLCTTPLREITSKMIARYAGKALTTWGALDDYKYFLPRVLELSAQFASRNTHGLELWLVASKLRRGGWDTWPDTERTAVSRFLRASWQATLEGSPLEVGASEYLQGIAALEAIEPYLEWWRQNESPSSLRHLAACARQHSTEIARSTPLWDSHRRDAPDMLKRNARMFADWLSHPSRCNTLMKGFECWCDEPWSTELAEAHDILECISPSAGPTGA